MRCRAADKPVEEDLCEILAAGGTVSVKTDDLALFQDVDDLLSSRLDPTRAPVKSPGDAPVLTEWEQECMRKSVPIYSREFRVR